MRSTARIIGNQSRLPTLTSTSPVRFFSLPRACTRCPESKSTSHVYMPSPSSRQEPSTALLLGGFLGVSALAFSMYAHEKKYHRENVGPPVIRRLNAFNL